MLLCSPHRFHAEQIVAAAEAGKHVFCEKPFTTTVAEADVALDAVRAAGVALGIGHERRFEPAVMELQERCRSGDLGIPLVFEGNFSQDKFLALPPDNWRLSPELAPVGPLSATGIHLVDLAVSILGEPTEVWARLSTRATTFGNGDTLLGDPRVRRRRDGQHHRHPDHPLHRPDLRPRVGGVDGDPGPQPPREPDRLGRHHGAPRAASGRSGSSPRTPRSATTWSASPRRSRGSAAYPVTTAEIRSTVRAFEAITRSAMSGAVERLDRPS